MWAAHQAEASLRLLQQGVGFLLIVVGVAAWPMSAFAYRPFDGTDAAVAEPGEIEIELQPAGVLRGSSQTTLIAPATVINYGFAKNWEAILQGQVETPISPGGPASLSQAGVLLKHERPPNGGLLFIASKFVRYWGLADIGKRWDRMARSRMTQLGHRPAFHVAVTKPGFNLYQNTRLVDLSQRQACFQNQILSNRAKNTWEALMSVGMLRKVLVVGASIFAISAAFAQQSVTTQQGPRADLGKLWYESNCATCHGLKGNGDGPMALYLTRKVPDLTTLGKRNNGILPVSEMYDVIVGQKQIPSHGSREMPVWGQEFREEGSKEHGVVVGDRYLGIFPFDAEAYVRARVLTIIEYINRIQVK